MNYLISESQMEVILEESMREKLSENMQKLNEVAKETIEEVWTVYKLNFKFLLTWGASIGGMIGPLKSWIEGNIPNIGQHEISLLALGAVAQFYYDNERKLKLLYKKIQDKGLESELEITQLKAGELKRKFVSFISSMGLTTTNMINTMSYAFLLPILEDIYLLSLGSDNNQALLSMMVKRLVASGAMVVTGATLSAILKKLLKKFQDKN